MISIIVPTYNRAHLISRAIDSVVRQTYVTWELIIVDDGSKDDTDEVVGPYLGDSRIKYIKKSNSGAAHSRNVGVENASYRWITFLDSDDEAKDQWLERCIAEIYNGAEIVCCGLERFDSIGAFLETVFPRANKSGTSGLFTNGGVYFLKKELFDKVGGFDISLRSGQHTELFFRIKGYLIEHGIRTTIIKEPLVNIYLHHGDRIRSDHRAKFEGSLYTYNKHADGILRGKKMRSTYEGIIAYNAFKINKRATAIKYGLKAFVNNPGKKKLFRLMRYLLSIKTR